jgi:hypothetical protein
LRPWRALRARFPISTGLTALTGRPWQTLLAAFPALARLPALAVAAGLAGFAIAQLGGALAEHFRELVFGLDHPRIEQRDRFTALRLDKLQIARPFAMQLLDDDRAGIEQIIRKVFVAHVAV